MHRRSSRAQLGLIILAFVAFVSLGLPDCALGVAWPSVRGTFGLPLSRLGQLLAASAAGYLVSSFFSGQIVRRFGVGKLLLGSCLLVTASLAGYALTPAWYGMVFFAVIGGLGAGAIDAGINTFAASQFSPRIVNWLHACWGIGATCGPLLMTFMLAGQLGWRTGYGVLAGIMGLLCIPFLLTLGLWQTDSETSSDTPASTASVSEAVRRPIVWVQILLFFVYVGIESTAGQLLFSVLTESRGIALTVAGTTVAAYWAALTIGRILFGQLAATLSRLAILRIGMMLAPLAAALLWWNLAEGVTMAAAVLLGVALAPIFPTLVSLTPDRVGRYCAPQAVGFQMAASAIGNATLPGAVGVLARHCGLEWVCIYLLAASVVLMVLHEAAVRMVGGEAVLHVRDVAGRADLPAGTSQAASAAE